MPSIDERVVSMAFENAVFEQRVAQTMSTLSKLNSSIANVGAVNGLANIEASANKVTLATPMSAMDKLKAKFGLGVDTKPITDIEGAGNKVTLATPMSAMDKLKAKLGMGVDPKPITDIENAGNKVTLSNPMSALDKLRAKLSRSGEGAAQGFSDIDRAGNKVTLEGPSRAVDKLQGKMGQLSAGSTFTDIEKASSRVTLQGLTGALDNVTAKFSVLQGAASVALGNIASQAAMKGASFAKSFAFGPLKQGFEEYGTNLQSIQTILANTEGQQVSGLKETQSHLKELNTYSDQTIYNFSEMAKNIGTFTAAGVDLDTSTQSIKGIANLAALSGSNSQQASTAMYQLSQAIASGKVGLQDWNSVVNAGMGGAVFQKALAKTASTMGTIEDGALKIDKATGKATINGQSFRESIMAKPGQKSWLTSEVLTTTLKNFTGDMKEADLIAQGFTKNQAQAIMKQAQTAKKAATEVKTLSQVFDVVRESIGSGWSQTFTLIFGDFNEAKKLFTNVTSYITGWVGKVSDARNKMLGDWKKAGGRTDLLEGLKAGFEAILSVIKPVKDAFRTVFPATTGKQLAEMTKNFRDFMEGLKLGEGTANNLKRTFSGFFAILHIGWTLIKNVGKVLFDLIGVAGKGSGGFLNFTGGIGDFLVNLDKAISKGNAFGGFFKSLGNILKIPVELIKAAAKAIFGLFGGFDSGKADEVGKGLDGVTSSIKPLEGVVRRVKEAWKQFSGVLDKFKEIVDPWFDQVRETFANFGQVIADGIKNADFNKVLLAFQTTFLGGIFLTIKKAISGGKSFDITGGALKNLSEGFEALTGNLAAMQKQVQATTIFTIAAAVLALAAGVKIMSTIEPKKLATAMTAIAVGLGELAGALRLMATGGAGVAMMPVVAASMIVLAGAVILLAGAMKIFATMSWEDLAKGLAGVAGSLVAIGGGMKAIGAVRIIPMAAGLILMGVALNIIAVAVKIFSQMTWEEMAKGLLGVGGALVAIGVGLAFVGPSVLVVGPGLVAAAIGLTILAGAISAFGSMKLADLAKGILGASLAVVALGIAMLAIPPTIGLQAAGLILLSVGLTALGGAVAIFGSMSIGKLAKGIIAMGLALVVLGTGLIFMSGTLLGSVALMAAAAGLAVLAPTLAFLGVLPWGTILKGLAAMALSMGVIAVVGLVAAPALLALGGALSVLGIGLVLIGTAIYIAAKGLSLLGENGAKGIGVLVSSITAFVALLPSLVINFVKGLVSIVEEIAKVAPKVVIALGVIIDTIIAFVIEQAPKLAKAVGALITAVLTVLSNNAGPMITAGWKLIQQLLTGISNNIGSVVTKVGEIITKFLNAFSTQAPKIIQSGAKVLGSFLGGIATALPQVIAKAAMVVSKFLEGVTNKLPGVISKGVKLVVTFLNGVASKVKDIIAAGVNLIVKIIDGIGNAIPRVIRAGSRLIRKFIDGIADEVPKLVNAGFRAVIRFLNGIASAIRENDDKVLDAMANVGDAIGDGLIKGLRRIGPAVREAISSLIKSLPKKALGILGIHSPSTVFQSIGENTMLGMSKGIEDGSSDVNKQMDASTNSMIDAAKSNLGKTPDMLDGIVDKEPVITPVLDLSNVKKEAQQLPRLTKLYPITAVTSTDQAASISAEQRDLQRNQAALETRRAFQAAPSVKFEQNNYSPEALSDVEIYRQTNNQLAQAKRALGVREFLRSA